MPEARSSHFERAVRTWSMEFERAGEVILRVRIAPSEAEAVAAAQGDLGAGWALRAAWKTFG